jgi:processive 1,2-diacylglycerol beta-glucosyltransferase
VGGFLLDPAFYAPPLNEAERRAILRERYELDPDRFTLLLTTGAVGANNHLALLEMLKHSRLRPQVIAVCGRSTQVWQDVAAWIMAHPEVPVHAIEFTDRMAELLQCASAVVARPGTGTTSEAVLCGCPILFNGLGGVMPQEMITVKFARAHGFARVLRRAADLPALLEPLMAAPETLAAARAAMLTARPSGTPRGILEMVAGTAHAAPRA